MTTARDLRTGPRQAAVDVDQAAADERRLSEIYRARARQLAARPAVSVAASWPALAFTLGSERICLSLAEVVVVTVGNSAG